MKRILQIFAAAVFVASAAAQERAAILSRVPRFVFVKHAVMGGSHYAYTEGQSDAQAESHFDPGAALCVFDPAKGVETLLEDKTGVIRDPDVSWDGKRILFAWKKSRHEDDYHLYEMEAATRKVRQLTFGLGVADYEGCYLPDGDIIFNSTRCVQTVDCWWTEVSNLYRCDKDGKRIRRLTFDQVHDNFPTMTPDGQILYTRWEYNDRGQIYTQPLFQMLPDGTAQGAFYGENSWFPTTILHARGIPGSQKVVAIATGHHSRQPGKLILIDPSKGREENAGAQLIAPVRETPAVKKDAYGQDGELFAYPYPLSETEYLVSYNPDGWAKKNNFGIYYVTMDGRKELLVADATVPCNRPVPLAARMEIPPRPTQVDYRRTDGTCYVQDVYAGPGLKGVARGTVKTMRVVALDFRPAGIGSNGNGGPGGGALVSTPVAIGNGAWDPKIILGDADVRADGSVFFRAPARVPFYFQLLDGKNRMVASMRSWMTLQPGENAACVGCHETKNSAPVVAAAYTSAPQTLRPFYGPARGFSFPREIQPILQRRCVGCHNEKHKFPLTGAEVLDEPAKRRWSTAYLTLTHADIKKKKAYTGDANHPVVNWISAQSAPPMLPPYSAGSAKSKLIEQLEAGHNRVKLTREETDKLQAWIDLSVPYCADYREANAWNDKDRQKYDRYQSKRDRLADEDKAAIAELLRVP
jgi:hypothetical protein